MSTALDAFLQRAKGTTVLVVGDVMLDAYLWGKVTRISPEAPVPIVQVTERNARLGGAANVALNLRALGAVPVVMSVIGMDPSAETMAARFLEMELDSVGLLRSKDRRTTVKTRVISGHQHVVRVDEEDTHPLSTEDEAAFIKRVKETIDFRKPAAILIEDYNKGVMTPYTISKVIDLAKAAGVPVAVDPKTTNFLAYRGVNLFKPNLKELREGMKLEVTAGNLESVRHAVHALEAALGNTITMVTMSEHGAYVHSASEEHLLPAHHRKIADVSGAGDTVIAVATLALAQQLPIEQMTALANLAGGLVCEEVGVVPIDPIRFHAEAERLELLK